MTSKDKDNQDFSDEMDKLREEAKERNDKMSPEEKEALQKARKRHSRKARIENLGYYKHPDEKKEDVFKDDEKEGDKNQSGISLRSSFSSLSGIIS